MRLMCRSPAAPLFAPVDLHVTGLAPFERVEARLHMTDDAGIIWSSQARFAADADGHIDTNTHPALAGDYTGLDPHGLFWSARPDGHDTLIDDILSGQVRPLMPALDPLAPYHWTAAITRADGGSATCKIVRHRLMPNLRQSRPPLPLQGMAFEPETPNGASLLVLGGSEGGVFPARAALLAASGFQTLSLAYFQHEGCPRVGRDLPLEYFKSALEWLQTKTPGKVGMIGVSRGSEAAQLTGLNWPDLVQALALWVPSHMVNSGLDLVGGTDFRKDVSAMWTLGGAGLPGAAFLPGDIAATQKRNADFNTPSGRRYADEFERAWAAAPQAMHIPIEQYQGPVLSVAGAQDALWPSALAATAITQAKGPNTGPRQSAIYQNAGHLIGTPNEPRPFPWLMHWSGGYMGVENGFCAYGGTREGAALAARQSWTAQTDFLNAHLI